MLRNSSIVHILLVAVVLLAAGCRPVRPLSTAAEALPGATAEVTTEATAEASTPTVETQAATAAGAYTGKLAIAGVELDIVVTLQVQNGTYSGTIDIPQQGATGIPLHDITVDGTTVHFEMLAGPQMAKFDGELADDGTIAGTMVQSGYEGTFTLASQPPPGATAASDVPGGQDGADATSLRAGVASTYTDPAGRFSVPVPTSWTVSEQAGYTFLSDPEGAIKVYLLTTENTDVEQAIADAWQLVDPAFDLEVDQTLDVPSPPGIEETVGVSYNTGDRNRIVQAQGRLRDGIVYLELYDVQMAGLQKRQAQLGIVSTGFKVLAQEETDLTGVQPLPVTAAITEPLVAFIEQYMAVFGIPGAAVGIVQDGQLVYAQGFGEANPETGEEVTPDTRMMIGSTGKSLTTMMMATLVDDGLMTWDTPAAELFPSFEVKDPELTETITMRNLVCACTGVPRRDMEWLFNYDSLTPDDTVAALADFEFYTDFGEAFQYSNQMVATAGYIAGQVAEANGGDLAGDYARALQSRILDPIGMISTTLSFDKVTAEGGYAIPHTLMLDQTYEPISLDLERSLETIGPAGAHWSTLNDMARYMITQLADGVGPTGEQVVSSENLKVTREPQIAINANASYGLGWMVTSYREQPVITHAGNALGFTSEFTFLPDADLGVIVLTNARASNLFNGSVTTRLLELVFEQEPLVEKELAFMVEQIQQQVGEMLAKMGDSIDEAAVQPFLGAYTHPVLGAVDLSLQDGKLLLDVGEFVAELRPYEDPDTQFSGYLQVSAPGQGLTYRLVEDDAGQPQIIFGQGAEEYTFTRK
jgi:CubicO group peptidase (beta-lactamase class C family)